MQVELMKALGDGTRLAIFERLCQREFTVNELTAQFDVSQPAVSQHLGVLKRCGLAQERRAGRFAHYRGRPEGLRPMAVAESLPGILAGEAERAGSAAGARGGCCADAGWRDFGGWFGG
jgi:DNA-binding transcriptional ArsR family regulator